MTILLVGLVCFLRPYAMRPIIVQVQPDDANTLSNRKFFSLLARLRLSVVCLGYDVLAIQTNDQTV